MGARQVDENTIIQLIEPHLDNRLMRIALQQVILNMGYKRMPEVRPQDYAELYRRFSNVISKFTAAKPDRKWDLI